VSRLKVFALSAKGLIDISTIFISNFFKNQLGSKVEFFSSSTNYNFTLNYQENLDAFSVKF